MSKQVSTEGKQKTVFFFSCNNGKINDDDYSFVNLLKLFPHPFFFHEYATWRYLKRGVKYEEISTFWHGHRNRCLIFLCEVR